MKNLPEIPPVFIDAFDYDLPQEKIAYQPCEKRDESKLLIYKNKTIAHDHYKNLSQYLPQHAHLYFNNTRVIAARLMFKKSTGGAVEIFLLEPGNGNYESLHDKQLSRWKCLVGGNKKWKHQETLVLEVECKGIKTILQAHKMKEAENYQSVEFSWNKDVTFSELIEATGQVPLPPYIKRENNKEDKERYQTVYAKTEGSVAAPTAGLHFTPELLETLNKNNIGQSFLTLHVGAGTFKPVTSSSIADHQMHEEYFEVDLRTIKQLAESNKTTIAVGTTSLRTLESLYWIGLRIKNQNKETDLQALELQQWEHLRWEENELLPSKTIFNFLLEEMQTRKINKLIGHTGICITPGYHFRVIDALITNFHQPKSTLLLLIGAIVGDEWKKIYATALEEGYRFLSYGDGSILFREK